MERYILYQEIRDKYLNLSESRKIKPRERESLYNSCTDKMFRLFGEKPGMFAENICKDVFRDNGLVLETRGPNLKIENIPKHLKKKHYLADGYLPEFDAYTESKMYNFFSSGTANEKLFGFLGKVQHYDKPCILILSGMHELRSFDECDTIMGCYNGEDNYKRHIFYDSITKLKDEGRLYVTTLSGLPNFLQDNRQKLLESKESRTK